MLCVICGSPETFREEVIRYCDNEGAEPFFVENVPAFVCVACGDRAIPEGVLAVIKSFRAGKGKPVDTIEVPVFDYTATSLT